MVAELVLVEVVEVGDVVEVDEPGWVVVGVKGTKATAAPTARMARTATPAKSAMLRSIDLPPEPSVIKTTRENTLFRLLGVPDADHHEWTPAYIRRDRGCGRGGMTLDELPARPQSAAVLR